MKSHLRKLSLSFVLLSILCGSLISPIGTITPSNGQNNLDQELNHFSVQKTENRVGENSSSRTKDLQYFNLSYHEKTMFNSEIEGINAFNTPDGPAGLRVHTSRIEAFGSMNWSYNLTSPSGGFKTIETVTTGDLDNDANEEIIILSSDGVLHALNSNGTRLWKTVTGLPAHNTLLIRNVTNTAGSEIILCDKDEASAWFYSKNGYPIDELPIPPTVDHIFNLAAGNINTTYTGNEMAFLIDIGGNKHLVVSNYWQLTEKPVFNVDLSAWTPSTTSVSTKLLIDDLAVEAGNETAVAIKRNGNDQIKLGIYNSTGGTTTRWGNAPISGGYGWSNRNFLQLTGANIEGTRKKVVLTLTNRIIIANDSTSETTISPSSNLRGTCIINSTASPNLDLGVVYKNGTSSQVESACLNLTASSVDTLWKKNISVGIESTYFATVQNSLYIALASGLYSVISENGDITTHASVIAGVTGENNIIGAQSVYNFASLRKRFVLNQNGTRIVDPPAIKAGAIIQRAQVGDYYPNQTGLEVVLVEKTFTDRNLTFFDANGAAITSRSLDPNLTIQSLGPSFPGAKKLPLGIRNTTSGNYRASIYDYDSDTLTQGSEIFDNPSQITRANLRDQTVFLYSTIAPKLLVINTDGDYLGMKPLPSTPDQLEVENLDAKNGNEIIYTYNDKLRILRDDLSIINTFDFDSSGARPFFIRDLLTNSIDPYQGKEILFTDFTGGGSRVSVLNQQQKLVGETFYSFSSLGVISSFVDPVNVSGDLTFFMASTSECAIIRLEKSGITYEFIKDESVNIPGRTTIPSIRKRGKEVTGVFTFQNTTGTWFNHLSVQKDFYRPNITVSSPSLKKLDAINKTITWKNNFSLLSRIKDDASIWAYTYQLEYYDAAGTTISTDTGSYVFLKPRTNITNRLTISTTPEVKKLRVEIHAEDRTGRTAQETLIIHFDRQAPSLRLQTPSSLKAIQDTINIVVLVTEEFQLNMVYLTVKNEKIAMTPDPTEPVENNTYRYTAQLSTNILDTGTNELTIVANDGAGHETTTSLTISKPGFAGTDLPPTLFWGIFSAVVAAIVIGIGAYLYKKPQSTSKS